MIKKKKNRIINIFNAFFFLFMFSIDNEEKNKYVTHVSQGPLP